MLNILWQSCYISGLIFIVANGPNIETQSDHLVTLDHVTETSKFKAKSSKGC